MLVMRSYYCCARDIRRESRVYDRARGPSSVIDDKIDRSFRVSQISIWKEEKKPCINQSARQCTNKIDFQEVYNVVVLYRFWVNHEQCIWSYNDVFFCTLTFFRVEIGIRSKVSLYVGNSFYLIYLRSVPKGFSKICENTSTIWLKAVSILRISEV